MARKLISPARWTDAYPAWPAWSRELDVLLRFADETGLLGNVPVKLRQRNHQRDEALNELRVAYWFHHMNFPIVQWEPPGLNGKVGEYLIQAGADKVFVEIKSPGWESELSDAERLAGRTHQPKYQGIGGGAFGNWQAVHRCIASPKTYPKFAPTQPNLLVIADDLMVTLGRYFIAR